MPNWCEGILKVRGPLENIRRFMEWGIDYGPGELQIADYDDELEFNITSSGECWIKGSNRHFVTNDEYMHIYEEGTLFLHLKAAWNIDANDLLEVCQTYGIDMRVQAFERGMQFSQIVEIIGGKITKNEVIKYDDWDWECPCPTLGG